MPLVHELLSQSMSERLQEGYICCLATAKAPSMLVYGQNYFYTFMDYL